MPPGRAQCQAEGAVEGHVQDVWDGETCSRATPATAVSPLLPLLSLHSLRHTSFSLRRVKTQWGDFILSEDDTCRNLLFYFLFDSFDISNVYFLFYCSKSSSRYLYILYAVLTSDIAFNTGISKTFVRSKVAWGLLLVFSDSIF
jgi:hypothetical protein